jgi:hypothetical protein
MRPTLFKYVNGELQEVREDELEDELEDDLEDYLEEEPLEEPGVAVEAPHPREEDDLEDYLEEEPLEEPGAVVEAPHPREELGERLELRRPPDAPLWPRLLDRPLETTWALFLQWWRGAPAPRAARGP